MVAVNKAGRQKAVVLATMINCEWIHHQTHLYHGLIKSIKTYYNSDNYESSCNRHTLRCLT
jgi:hypothetical protein